MALRHRSRDGGREPAWYDDAAGRLVRPYTVSNGRTRPTAPFDLLTLVRATGRRADAQGPEHARALALCRVPVSVAEIAGQLRLPVVVTKVLLADLVDCGALTAHAPATAGPAPRTDRALLEAVLHGLRTRL